MRLKGIRLLVACLLVGLALPHPDGHGYYPMARSLWDTLTGDVGHGPRWYWTAVDLVVLVVYTAVAFLVIWSVRALLRRL